MTLTLNNLFVLNDLNDLDLNDRADLLTLLPRGFIDDRRLPSFMTRVGLKRRPEQGTKGCSFDCRCKDTTFSGRMQAFTLTFYARKAISSCNTISSIDFLSELYCKTMKMQETTRK